MQKRSQRALEPVADADRTASSGAVTEKAAPTRKPYQRPRVEKKRSVAEATLISGVGLVGTLTTGSGGFF